MQFIKADFETVADHLAQSIQSAMDADKRVLWLISGGSAAQVAVAAQRKIRTTDALAVAQVDERFGPIGHKDSNWQKLLDTGFDTASVTSHPILTGKDMAATTREYNETLSGALSAADVAIGLFGIGADGHTAGILPGSPAVESKQLVAAYTAADFQRITITPVCIAQLDTVITYVADEKKQAALQQLVQQDIPIAEQPAQALKLVHDSYVYYNGG